VQPLDPDHALEQPCFGRLGPSTRRRDDPPPNRLPRTAKPILLSLNNNR
jgi:hypothetical protein